MMTMPTISHPESHPPYTSPRSSTSSSNPSSGLPLTPLFDLTSTVGDMKVDDDSTSETAHNDITSPSASSNLVASTFASFSFGTSRSEAHSTTSTEPPPISPSELPKAGFSFGTCPSTPFLGTPTAEMGAFEYPRMDTDGVPPEQVHPAPPPQLGHTHRRNSIIPRPSDSRRGSLDPRASISSDRRPSFSDFPSPPAARRSSTLSTIHTLPSSGRRPSILHSNTNPALFPTSSSPSTSRRPSLMFPPRPLPINIPPSLLARRGSLPAAQLFGIPTADAIPRLRASYAAPSSAGFNTTTPALYHRRDSMFSESGASSGSSQTTSAHTDTFRHDHTLQTAGDSRRSSLPHMDHAPPSNSPLATGRRRPSSPGSRNEPSPLSPLFRRTRLSSTSTSTRASLHSAGSTLSSSEEDEDEDSVDPLPTPSSFGSRGSIGMVPPSFTDPWGPAPTPTLGVGAVDLGIELKGGGRRGSDGGKGGRPVLESIPSDDTERGNRSS